MERKDWLALAIFVITLVACSTTMLVVLLANRS